MMGVPTPNIDRICNEGASFTDAYGGASCTAGRAAFITGQVPLRTGLTTVGMPGAPLGIQPEDPTLAELLKPEGYVTAQIGKNHLGDRNEFLPTVQSGRARRKRPRGLAQGFTHSMRTRKERSALDAVPTGVAPAMSSEKTICNSLPKRIRLVEPGFDSCVAHHF
jgi:arylsulfatase A-like enzyme